MSVPSSIADLSTSEGSNSPLDSETITATTRPSDYLRAHAAIIKEACGTVYTATGADTISFSTTPTFAAYAAGMRFKFISAGANTGAASLEVNSLGAKAVTKEGTTALAAGDIASGATVEVVYDGTRFQLVAGRSIQPLDATLTALAGVLTAASKIPYATALNTAGELDLSTNTSLGTSDTTLSSQKAVKTYVDTQVATAVADSDFTGANQSLSTSGYQKLPGDLILQWGTVTTSASATVPVTFPIPFVAEVYSVTVGAVASGNGFMSGIDTQTTIGFNASAWSATSTRASVGCFWLAIGK